MPFRNAEFWIDPTCFYATTGGGGGYQIHKAYTEEMKSPSGLVCFVSKGRLDNANARIAALEVLNEKLQKTLEEITS